jgi:hypothetical protein
VLQAKLVKKGQEDYKKTGLVKDRPRVSEGPTPRSRHSSRFQERYGFTVTDLGKVQDMFPDTDLDGILARGAAAYASSGSRPNVSSFQWRFARLASVLTGGKAYSIDKTLVGDKSRAKIFA